MLQEARARGIVFTGLSEHAVRPPREQALVLGYAVSAETGLRAAVKELAEIVSA